MLELQEISAAKAGADIQAAIARRNTQTGQNFMMEPHCTPRYNAAGIFENRFAQEQNKTARFRSRCELSENMGLK
jgi:hypothetical protein